MAPSWWLRDLAWVVKTISDVVGTTGGAIGDTVKRLFGGWWWIRRWSVPGSRDEGKRPPLGLLGNKKRPHTCTRGRPTQEDSNLAFGPSQASQPVIAPHRQSSQPSFISGQRPNPGASPHCTLTAFSPHIILLIVADDLHSSAYQGIRHLHELPARVMTPFAPRAGDQMLTVV